MELRHLRYFLAVAEELHFGRAAERLRIAQPPLSQQIRQLENELGVALLVRTTRHVELTEAGRRYAERARDVIRAVESAGREAARVAAGEVGRVAIGFVGSATYDVLPSLARALRAASPGVELELHGEMLVSDQVTALLDGTLDIALLRPPADAKGLDVVVVREEPLVAVLPDKHRLARARGVSLLALRNEPFVTYPAGRAVIRDAIRDACAEAGFVPDVAHEVAETSTLVAFVAAGLGVALVPASVQSLRVVGARYRPIIDIDRQVQLAVATRQGETAPQVIRVRALALDHIRTLGRED